MDSQEFNEQYLGSFEPRKQSDLLTQFYQAYLWWIEGGAREDLTQFSRYHGLCGSLRSWANHNAQVEYRQLSGELNAQFTQARLDFLHPFHMTAAEYNREVDRGAAHTNPIRIQWVKDHAQ